MEVGKVMGSEWVCGHVATGSERGEGGGECVGL